MITYKILCYFKSNTKNCLILNQFARRNSSLSINEGVQQFHASSLNHSQKKLLKIAMIGLPNAGKSTLINQLVERRVLAMSKKVHTTRCRARAVHIENNTQLIFLDTPGVVSFDEYNKFNLEDEFLSASDNAISEANVIGVVQDVSNSYTRSTINPKILRLLHTYKDKESFLVLNKVDTIKSKRTLLDLSTTLTGGKLRNYSDTVEWTPISAKAVEQAVKKQTCWQHFSDVFMISALLGHGTVDLKNYLLGAAKPGDWPFELDQFTDQTDVKIIQDTVKSRLLEYLPQEIPYGLKVQLEYLDTDTPEIMRIVVLIYCKSDKINKLVLGPGGSKIKQVAKEAERELSDTFYKDVFLKLVVHTNPSLKS